MPGPPGRRSSGYTAPTGGAGAGLNKLPGAVAKPIEAQQNYPVSDSVLLIIKTTKVPQQSPPLRVPFGSTVRVRATNGTTAGNTDPVFVAQNAQALLLGMGTPLMPLDDVQYPVDSLVLVWVSGTANDGVVISITRGSANSN